MIVPRRIEYNKVWQNPGAAVSFRAAECIWDTSSPPQAVEVNAKLESLVDERPEFRRYVQMADWKVEEKFRSWEDRS